MSCICDSGVSPVCRRVSSSKDVPTSRVSISIVGPLSSRSDAAGVASPSSVSAEDGVGLGVIPVDLRAERTPSMVRGDATDRDTTSLSLSPVATPIMIMGPGECAELKGIGDPA